MKTAVLGAVLAAVVGMAGCAVETGEDDDLIGDSSDAVTNGRCAGTTGTKTANLKVMTVNLRHDVDSWQRRFELIADEIVRLDPDVIGAQEVEFFLRDNQAEKLNDLIAKRGHAKYNLYAKRKSGVAGFFTGEGIAIMSRWKITEKEHEDIGEKRVSIRARIQHPNGPIDMLDTHLEAGGGERGAEIRDDQARQTIDLADRDDDCHPTFLTGDMNAKEDSAALKRFFAAGFVDSFKKVHGAQTSKVGNTSSVKLAEGAFEQNPKNRIDFVLARGAGGRTIEPIDSVVCFKNHDAKGFYPSDHFGVMTTFRVKL
ncbi:MAG: endonuclease/exonuclease/phosphatase family protein [Labilithrix sp.]|nr:endonuclease/exonuclease/phosphatase family protein [Labilithrix sp.]MCW5811796.1 endonuclease/exonuclease/phosphatase family protein [Labilithrix sp.]